MTQEQNAIIESAIIRSRFYMGGETFDAGNFSGGILPKTVRSIARRPDIEAVMRAMVERGTLAKVEDLPTGARYQKAGGGRHWLTRPWRAHSDQELGVESVQFGVMA